MTATCWCRRRRTGSSRSWARIRRARRTWPSRTAPDGSSRCTWWPCSCRLTRRRRRAFRERVAALGRLSHPAILRIIEARRTAAGDGCVVAPYVNGTQLARYCRSPHVDGALLARIFSAICDAIASAHGQGVCHGRLGPDMVIVRPMGDDPAAPVVLGFSVFPAESTATRDGRPRAGGGRPRDGMDGGGPAILALDRCAARRGVSRVEDVSAAGRAAEE